MSEETIVEALAYLQPNPDTLWNLIEKHYRPNFFEPVILKRYASLFEARDETAFNHHLSSIRIEAAREIAALSK